MFTDFDYGCNYCTGNVPPQAVFNPSKQIVSGEGLEDCRLVFESGKAHELFVWLMEKHGLTQRAIANEFGVPRRTLMSYCNGRCQMKQSTFKKIVSFDADAARYKKFIIDRLPLNWGAKKGGKKGMAGLWKKYGLAQIKKWRKEEFLKRKIPLTELKQITVPTVINCEIAELFGACLGDGTFTDYFIRISGDKRFDNNYFSYLSGIVERNFGLKSKILAEKSRNLLSLEIRSKLLIDFFKEKFGISLGDKIRNKTVVPQFIIENDALAKSCLRGLMDTDGSICKRGNQLCFAFTSRSPPLLNQIYEFGVRHGYFSYKVKGQVGSNSWKIIQKYFAEVGSSNLRHIIRFDRRLKNRELLFQKETLKYFPQYECVKGPFFWARGPVVKENRV